MDIWVVVRRSTARYISLAFAVAMVSLTAALLTAGEATAASPTRYINASVATLWTSPTAPRPIDRPALGDRVEMRAWSQALDTSARLGLVGRIETQALFGEPVLVLTRRGSWTRIVVVDSPRPATGMAIRAGCQPRSSARARVSAGVCQDPSPWSSKQRPGCGETCGRSRCAPPRH